MCNQEPNVSTVRYHIGSSREREDHAAKDCGLTSIPVWRDALCDGTPHVFLGTTKPAITQEYKDCRNSNIEL
jgi:hypothetical protein